MKQLQARVTPSWGEVDLDLKVIVLSEGCQHEN